MDFKRYLAEAEWVNGQRYPTTEALWHVLQPLAGSNRHLLALGNTEIRDEPRKILKGDIEVPRERGTRAHPTHFGPLDPNIRAVSVRTFMNYGVPAFNDYYSETSDDKLVLHILQVANPNDVWTIDPVYNEKNPFTLMITHWKDMEQEFERLYPRTRVNQNAENGGFNAHKEWEDLTKSVQHAYRSHDEFQQTDISRLRMLFHLIYVEAPRLLNWVKTGLSYYRSRATSMFRPTDHTSPGPQAGDMHMPKSVKWDFKIIAKTLPLADSPWAMILDPRAVQTVNTVVIPATFAGFRKPRTPNANVPYPFGQSPDYGDTFYAPNARSDRVQKLADKLAEDFQETLVAELENFLYDMDEALEEFDYSAAEDFARRVKFVEDIVNDLQKILSSIRAIQRDYSLPENLRDAIGDFEEQGHNILIAARQRADDQEYDDEDFFGDESPDVLAINIARRAFQKVITALAQLTK